MYDFWTHARVWSEYIIDTRFWFRIMHFWSECTINAHLWYVDWSSIGHFSWAEIAEHPWHAGSVLWCVAACCSVLQRVAACCSVLQCVAVCCTVLQCVALCCGLKLQSIHGMQVCTCIHSMQLWCSGLQHVAACCSVLQCIARVHVCTCGWGYLYFCTHILRYDFGSLWEVQFWRARALSLSYTYTNTHRVLLQEGLCMSRLLILFRWCSKTPPFPQFLSRLWRWCSVWLHTYALIRL